MCLGAYLSRYYSRNGIFGPFRAQEQGWETRRTHKFDNNLSRMVQFCCNPSVQAINIWFLYIIVKCHFGPILVPKWELGVLKILKFNVIYLYWYKCVTVGCGSPFMYSSLMFRDVSEPLLV